MKCLLALSAISMLGFLPSSLQSQLPPRTTYQSGTPERQFLEMVWAWKGHEWGTISRLSRKEWRDKHSSGGGDEFDDPILWAKAMLGWGTPRKLGPISREQLSAGIVRLSARLDIVGQSGPEVRQLTCKIYPAGRRWELDIDHCSMLAGN